MAGLTALQNQILTRFFERDGQFFLTGGAALVGFHLHHRVTHDLDFFTTAEVLDDGERTLKAIAESLDLHMEPLRRSPDFRRFLLQGPSEGVVVDLVRDVSPQLFPKLTVGRLVIDSAQEILANKLCTLLSRIEARDLVDVARLEESGLNPIATLELASRKDAGVTPAQLAWVLSTFPVSVEDETHLGMSQTEIEEYRDSLVRRLTAEAFPKGSA